jgi:tripartite-type tricarboxylate transporter receptor subunit TctC
MILSTLHRCERTIVKSAKADSTLSGLSEHGRMRRASLIYAAGLAGLALAPRAIANTYPNGPVQLVVPFTPGSGSDLLARVFGEGLSAALSQPVVVINRPGAGGTIAAASVAKAQPDGRTLAVVGMGHLANPALYKSLPYDTLGDFAAISPLGTFPNVLIAPSDGSISSVQRLVTLAKASPGRLNYASAGVGSAAHINMQMLIAATGMSVVHIPLKGASEIVTETVAGRCQLGWAPLGASIGTIKSGKLAALAISSRTRSSQLPDVPTIAEVGYPAAECNVWVGLLAPAKTPKDIVQTLSDEIRRIAEVPAVREKLVAAGAEPLPMTPADFERLMRTDYGVLDKLMRNAS